MTAESLKLVRAFTRIPDRKVRANSSLVRAMAPIRRNRLDDYGTGPSLAQRSRFRRPALAVSETSVSRPGRDLVEAVGVTRWLDRAGRSFSSFDSSRSSYQTEYRRCIENTSSRP